MTLLALSLLAAPAPAREVENGIRAAVFPRGLRFVEEQVSGLDYALEYPEIAGEYDCYQQIGVRNFNLDIPIDEVDLWTEDGVLSVIVEFGTIRGEDMDLYGESEDWLDYCVSFETTIEYINLEDARLAVDLRPVIRDGDLELEVASTPSLIGDLDTNIAWFPDDLALYWFEDTLFELVGEKLGEALPGEIAPLLSDALLGLQYDNFTVAVGLEDIDIDLDGVALAATPDITWKGDDGCPYEGRARGGDGRTPEIVFRDEGAEIAVGVTEGMLNELFQSAWQDGFFCFSEEYVDGLLDLVRDYFSPEVSGLAGSASLGAPPALYIEEGGIRLVLENLQVDLTGVVDGQQVSLLSLNGDIDGLMEPSLDHDLSALRLALHDLVLDIALLRADFLVSDEPDAEDHIAHFAENWVSAWANEQTSSFVLLDTLYNVFDVIIRVDRIEYQTGGVAVYIDLYDSDDPEVDSQAPETDAQLIDTGEDSATFSFQGTDDREGALAFSYSLDGASWSSWSTEAQVTITDLPPASYVVDVIARDQWLNVDATPAQVSFDLAAPAAAEDPAEEDPKGCGCASTRGAGAWAWLGLLALVGLRRRR